MPAADRKPNPRFNRSLTDCEIVELACFPLMMRSEALQGDYAFALLMDAMSQAGANPLALVVWPTGVKIVMTIRPGERTGAARDLMIASYRAAEAGHRGSLATGGAR